MIDQSDDFILQEHRYSLRRSRHLYWVRVLTRHGKPRLKVAESFTEAAIRAREWKFVKEDLPRGLPPALAVLPGGAEERVRWLLDKLVLAKDAAGDAEMFADAEEDDEDEDELDDAAAEVDRRGSGDASSDEDAARMPGLRRGGSLNEIADGGASPGLHVRRSSSLSIDPGPMTPSATTENPPKRHSAPRSQPKGVFTSFVRSISEVRLRPRGSAESGSTGASASPAAAAVESSRPGSPRRPTLAPSSSSASNVAAFPGGGSSPAPAVPAAPAAASTSTVAAPSSPMQSARRALLRHVSSSYSGSAGPDEASSAGSAGSAGLASVASSASGPQRAVWASAGVSLRQALCYFGVSTVADTLGLPTEHAAAGPARGAFERRYGEQLPSYLSQPVDLSSLDKHTSQVVSEKISMDKLKREHEKRSMAKGVVGATLGATVMRVVSWDAWLLLLLALNVAVLWIVKNRHDLAKQFAMRSIERRVKFTKQVWRSRFGGGDRKKAPAASAAPVTPRAGGSADKPSFSRAASFGVIDASVGRLFSPESPASSAAASPGLLRTSSSR